MGILRYTASADTTITNAFQSYTDNSLRATGSNMGNADVVEIFSIYGRRSGSNGHSTELSRGLMKFPISSISTDRTNGKIPASGSVIFNLKLYNAKHPFSMPHNYQIDVHAVSRNWTEGLGIDMRGYSDTTVDKVGSNWIKASSSTSWTTIGGDYHATPKFSQSFAEGDEDMSIDISEIVEQWITGTKDNHGLEIKLTNIDEGYFSCSVSGVGQNSGSVIYNTDGANGSRYTKKFFARTTEFFFKKPVIEAVYDNSKKDDRANLYISSSLLSGQENLNRLYFHNYYNGRLMDIADNRALVPTASFYYSSGSVPEGSVRTFLNSSNTEITALKSTRAGTGSYYVDVAIPSAMVDGTYPYLVDVWFIASNQVLTGSAILPKAHQGTISPSESKYFLSMPNLRSEYRVDESVRLRLYARKKGWSPNIYSVAKNKPENLILTSGSYRVLRAIDDYEVIGHNSVGTLLSYDVSGNYFDLSTKVFEPGYQYMLKFAVYDGYVKSYVEQPYEFKFRIVE